MPDIPLLTIGIPHLDRTEHLQFAIDSCLKQRTPVEIVVADQGQTDETAYLMEQYETHPNVHHVLSSATCLWENWEFTARECDTKYFAWLQDDDTVTRGWSTAVCKSFEAFPHALHIQASCYVSPDRIHAIRRGWNGPQVGVNMQDLIPEQWHGEYVIGSMYLMSWALSPGVAFRCGAEFNESLSAMPTDCDLFLERLVLAEMGSRGDWVAHPITAGFWHHHGRNESYSQNLNGSIEQQYKTMVDHLDRILDRTEAWSHAMTQWCGLQSAHEVISWLKECSTPGSRHPIAMSRHCDAIQEAMATSLNGRVIGGCDPTPQQIEDAVLMFE